jgi:HAE1 family hydrophobic/amphiphilic exporter-1/multidrug efflux pump
VLTLGGLNLLTNAYTSNNASLIVMLKPWDERKSAEEKLQPILAAARKNFAAYPEAVSLVFPPPPINGLGNASGFVFELQDKTGRSPQELAATKDKFMQVLSKSKDLTGIYSAYSTSIPQIKLDIDRDKVRTLDIPINDVFRGLQIYLGGLQVNDFNLFGRTYKVMLQAEQDFRKSPENIKDIYVRSRDGSMVPLSTLSKIGMTTGRRSRRQRAPARLRLRMDQHRVPGKGSKRHAGARIRHGDGLRLPGPGSAIRKLGRAFLGTPRSSDRGVWRAARYQSAQTR